MKSFRRMNAAEIKQFYTEWVDKKRFPDFESFVSYLVENREIKRTHKVNRKNLKLCKEVEKIVVRAT